MVLVRGLHTTTKKNLQGVLRSGLGPRVPKEHNWPCFPGQPQGVYISPSGNDDIWYRPGDERRNPVLQVHYCGPMEQDQYVVGSFICHLPIPRSMIRLVVDNVWD